MRNFLIALTRNPVSLLGTTITTASAVLFLTLFTLQLVGFQGNPYLGILAYLILPGFFILGLILIPIGVWRERRQARTAAIRGELAQAFPVIDLNRERTRRMVLTFLGLTLFNIIILSAATYKGVETMDSVEFCGLACHSVMAPEYTAYLQSPHARVECVDCHIGPGAPWFVKSKLSGAWQVVSVNFDLYPRPIPVPIDNLRPARETCEQCHWPAVFVGDRLKVKTHYENDEANTELQTVLLLRVGGIQGRKSQGIHWHVDPGIQIRYLSDDKREKIYEVELTEQDGTKKLFKLPESQDGQGDPQGAGAANTAAAAAEAGTWRVMDCVDCHNRPSHTFKVPEEAVDEAIHDKRIDRSLPFVRREGLRLIQASYPSHEEARNAIVAGLASYYEKSYPDIATQKKAAIEQSGEALATVYASNVFPTMDVEWGTYPNHIGHQNTPGCFRCHDDEHQTADGETIPQDCFTCHSLLAMDEPSPKILQELQP